ncbi:hypothetical protein F4823DRAFT_607597 [Ustulina deusta]|nr:hypothetical protein F4823DRAFT_607597 [Ustulina deusta]
MARGSFPPHCPTTVGTCHVVLLGPLFTCSVLLWKTCLRTIPLRGLHPFFLSHCFYSRAALGHSSNSRLVSKPLTFLQYSIPLMAPERAPDYIIIGGGTSGLVVANRLSEDPSIEVLVLEAGGDLSLDPRVNIPALWTSLMGSDADWQYKSLPQ